MLDDEQGHPRNAEGAQFTHGEPLEGGGGDQAGGRAQLGDLDCVVETPRRARPSVGRAGQDDVALLGQLGEQFRRRRRGGVGLAPMDDLANAEAVPQEAAQIDRQLVEVVLGVVDEADDQARPVRRQRRDGHPLLLDLSDGVHYPDARHGLLLSGGRLRLDAMVPDRHGLAAGTGRNRHRLAAASGRNRHRLAAASGFPDDDQVIVALDIGTSSSRAGMYDERGAPVPGRFHQERYEPTTTPDGGVEHDPERLLRAVVSCLDGVLAGSRAPEILGVGVTSFWHRLLGFDAAGRPATSILTWADTRAARDADWLRGALDEDQVHARTGCHFHACYWPAKLRWLARDQAAA